MEKFLCCFSAPCAGLQAFVRSFCLTGRGAPGATVTLMVIAILIAGCGGGTSTQAQPEPIVTEPAAYEPPRAEPVQAVPAIPTPLIGERPVRGESIVVTSGLDPDSEISRERIGGGGPWDLVTLADQTTGANGIALRLAAINSFLERQDYTNATIQADLLEGADLTRNQVVQLTLKRSLIADGTGNNEGVLENLQAIRNDPELKQNQRIQTYALLARSQLALQRNTDAAISLMLLDPLVREDIRIDNQRILLALIQHFDSLQISLLSQAAEQDGLSPNMVPGWVEFGRIEQLPEARRRLELGYWRNRFPAHPALEGLIGEDFRFDQESYNHIALLLPMTSPYASAAKAFYDGFTEAHHNDNNLNKPAISLVDIGDDPELAGFYYRSAAVEGADFVVGPLGREAVNALLDLGEPALPTLVIGNVDPRYRSPYVFGISLSPEQEAKQVAERAYADGHRQAAIMRSATDWGARAAGAFTDAWLELGGRIVTDNSFPNDIEDYSAIIQRLFEIDQSSERRQELSRQLGVRLSFSPRRRNDIDMMFVAANTGQARLLVPQIRFFKANDLPIYATSNVFSGSVEPALNADLDQVIFGDMRWMFDLPQDPDSEQEESDTTAAEPEPGAMNPAQPDQVPHSPYTQSPLDRLYALGLESYYLVPRLPALRNASWQQYNGRAFNASVKPDGNVQRHLDWATFENGNIKRLEAAPPIVREPGPELPDPARTSFSTSTSTSTSTATIIE